MVNAVEKEMQVMRESYDYTNLCLRRNGTPWLPVMGEFHFSRCRPEFWEEELRKMQAGGVSIVSTYLIWIHHEEERGQFDFTGCRDLRRFLQLAEKVGISVFLRLGPWVHGEVRNGGFPDWLVRLGGEIHLRSNDPAYLELVRTYWTRAAEQVSGLMWRDGGPVIGIQIENEYGHVGGLRGEPGEAHMRTLAGLARELGFDAPLYTATGWGGAVTGGLLPVMGGYCEAPWAETVAELPANGNFVFSHTRNDALIACDHGMEDSLSFDSEAFPYLTAELGGGLQVTRHRRPVASGRDIGAMSLVKLGSGAAMLGYYMYHGGSNPEGKLSTLQESRATGAPNDLPEINYDFNAPIRQYGTISDTYKEVRLLAMFARDFGEDFVTLPAEIDPEGVDPEDTHTLRMSWRHDGTHGYVFVNNHQRRRTMDAHTDVILQGRCNNPVTFPAVRIQPGDYFFFPYNLPLGDAVLRCALASPLCRLDDETGSIWVFYGDQIPHFTWKDEKSAPVLHISREQALNASKVRLEKDYLILTEDFVWVQDGNLIVAGGPDTEIKTFPALKELPVGFSFMRMEGGFAVYRRGINMPPAQARLDLQSRSGDAAIYTISVDIPEHSSQAPGIYDWLLAIEFSGESMDLFCGERKLNDYFYTGQPALLSLRYFDYPDRITAVVHTLRTDDKQHIFLENWPEMIEGCACRIDCVNISSSFVPLGFVRT